MAKNLRSSNKQRTESKGTYSNKFQEDDPILLQDELLYDRVRKYVDMYSSSPFNMNMTKLRAV